VSGTLQGGNASVGGIIRASIWSGAAASRVDLHPSSATGGSTVLGLSQSLNKQLGYTVVSGVTNAALWTGSSASYQNIHPPGAGRSEARAIDINIVGIATYGGENHAMMWAGASPSTFVDLNPAGAVRSVANDIDNNYTVGSATFSGSPRASFWATGSSAAWIDLHPSAATTSVAHGIQSSLGTFGVVGTVTYSGSPRATLWTSLSSAATVDLHPSAATTSVAVKTFGGMQVGSADFAGRTHASLWNSSASSWEDLSLSLAGTWTFSQATDIWSDGSTIYISGHGANPSTGQLEALLWTRPIPTPATAAIFALAAGFASRRRRSASHS
jgi:hypothetical protein